MDINDYFSSHCFFVDWLAYKAIPDLALVPVTIIFYLVPVLHFIQVTLVACLSLTSQAHYPCLEFSAPETHRVQAHFICSNITSPEARVP